MITIEAWRCSIGFHNCFTGRHVFREENSSYNGIATGARFLRSSLGSTLISAKLIFILLLIGGVETNPGPNHGGVEGNNAVLLLYITPSPLIHQVVSKSLNDF